MKKLSIILFALVMLTACESYDLQVQDEKPQNEIYLDIIKSQEERVELMKYQSYNSEFDGISTKFNLYDINNDGIDELFSMFNNGSDKLTFEIWTIFENSQMLLVSISDMGSIAGNGTGSISVFENELIISSSFSERGEFDGVFKQTSYLEFSSFETSNDDGILTHGKRKFIKYSYDQNDNFALEDSYNVYEDITEDYIISKFLSSENVILDLGDRGYTYDEIINLLKD